MSGKGRGVIGGFESDLWASMGHVDGERDGERISGSFSCAGIGVV